MKAGKQVGFVCAINGNELKVFQWSEKLVTVVSSEAEPFHIGDFVQIFSDGLIDLNDNFQSPFEVLVEGGELFIKTIATSPNVFELPEDMGKYQGKVWSPWIHFIRDEEGIFADWESLEGLATAKFIPNAIGDVHFELVKVEPIPEGVSVVLLSEAPWRQELLLRTCDRFAQPRNVPVNSFNLSRHHLFPGVCVAVNVENFLHNPEKLDSSPTTSILWSWSLGQCRSLESIPIELGVWYSFETNDKRKAGKQMRHYDAVTATYQKVIRQQLVTRVVEGNVEIDTFFTFNQDRMEPIESRELGNDWDSRRQKLFSDAHFQDHLLGTVELPMEICEALIKAVEVHRAQQSPERREFLKHDAIQVHATVALLPNWMHKHFQQGSSIFEVARVNSVAYGVDGEEILM